MKALDKNQKLDIARVILSTVLLITALVVSGHTIKLVLYIISYLIAGYEVLLKSAKNISRGRIFDENFLMSLATIGAFIIKEYPEAVAVMLFYQIGEFFEDYATDKSRKSVSALMDIRPDHANVEKDGQLVRVNPAHVKVHDIIVVKPGERVPLDGTVIEGSSSLDMSSLTGESLPVDVTKGDTVLSGSINAHGLLRLSVDTEYEQSTVARILELIEDSTSKKAKTERFISTFSKYYTPVVVISALLVALIPPLLFNLSWNDRIYRALVFLVISCPCALVLSVPLSFFSAIGAASKNGILIKGGSYIEALSKTKTVILDKTGTVTEGIFKVSAIHPEKVSKPELLEIAAIAESYSDHPISVSLKNEYYKQIDKSRISDIKEIAGHGIKAIIDDRNVIVGNEKLMEKENIQWHECSLSGTMVHVAVDDEYMGHIVISDRVKKDAKDAVDRLKQLNIHDIVMLTGDNRSSAQHIAETVGIKGYEYSLLPHQKAEYVENRLKENKKGTIVFAGDGINDAPVIALSDVGISMGLAGSSAAIEASDVVIMDDMPSKIPQLIRLSKKTMSIATQNVVFAIGIKFAALILGAAGYATLWMAVFADVGVSVLAVLNAIRLLNVKKQ